MNYSNEIFNEALILLENECEYINNKQLKDLGMESPNRNESRVNEISIGNEAFNIPEMIQFVEDNLPKLQPEQLSAFETITKRIQDNSGGIFFLDAPGGTGKTFLLNLLLASVRKLNEIAIAVASSGIAATLLNGGRTAHSTFKLPLNFGKNENYTCNISKNSDIANRMTKAKLIVWDESPMAHKKALEALNETMKDLRGNEQIMGGALLLLAGNNHMNLKIKISLNYIF